MQVDHSSAGADKTRDLHANDRRSVCCAFLSLFGEEGTVSSSD
jgi:hypothetical protein